MIGSKNKDLLARQLYAALIRVGHSDKSLSLANKSQLLDAAYSQINLIESLRDPTGAAFDYLDELHSTYDGGRDALDRIIANDIYNCAELMLGNLNKISHKADSLPEVFFAPFLLLCQDIDSFENVSFRPVTFINSWTRGYGQPRPGITQVGSQVWIGSRRIDFIVRRDRVGRKPQIMFIEIDSIKYHMNERAMFEDRRRDRLHLKDKIITVRFMAKEIFANPMNCYYEFFEIYNGFYYD